jgi:hypothetical protein
LHRPRTRSLARIETELAQQQQPDRQVTQPQSAPLEWKPSIVLGSPLNLEGEDLNAIQLADRKVEQTRLWASHYQGVPYFQEAHQKAIEERAQLDETAEENLLPLSALKSTQEDAIQQRLRLLRSLLQDSTSPDERLNIEAAVAGYESGAIPYSDSYTLIWAGRIVDRCPDFSSFTVDRAERLDRYAALYGPGWLWYEPPLAGGGGSVVAKKSFCLESKASWRKGTDNMGHYRILMSFRRRMERVARGPRLASVATPSTSTPISPRTTGRRRKSTAAATTPTVRAFVSTQTIPQPNTSLPGRTVPDPDGPPIVCSMLLDSGATLPSLYEGDLPKLGIYRHQYPAQSARTVNTADSVIEARVYELDVSILGGEDDVKSITSTTTPTTTNDPEPLSCTTPVLIFAGKAPDDNYANHTDHTPSRLSGLLPFHVCYLSSAPGMFRLWMGEDRRDVLGAARLPGLARYGEILGGINATERARRATAGGAAAAGGGGGSATAATTTNTPGGNTIFSQFPSAPTLGCTVAPVTSTALSAGTLPKLVASLESWAKHALGKPDRVIFEHQLPDGSGYVLREEDAGDGFVTLAGPKGTDFEHLDAKNTQNVRVLRVKQKKYSVFPDRGGPARQETRGKVRKRRERQSVEERPGSRLA